MGEHFILNFSKPYLNLRVERKQMITYRGLILMVCIIIWGGTVGAACSVGNAGAGL